MLSLGYTFPLLQHVSPSPPLLEGGRKGKWVGTSDVMLTDIIKAMGNLTVSVHMNSLVSFILFLFLSCDGLWFHLSLVLSFNLKHWLQGRHDCLVQEL